MWLFHQFPHSDNPVARALAQQIRDKVAWAVTMKNQPNDPEWHLRHPRTRKWYFDLPSERWGVAKTLAAGAALTYGLALFDYFPSCSGTVRGTFAQCWCKANGRPEPDQNADIECPPRGSERKWPCNKVKEFAWRRTARRSNRLLYSPLFPFPLWLVSCSVLSDRTR